MTTLYKHFICTIIVSLCFFNSKAQDTISVSPSNEEVLIGNKLMVYADISNRLLPESIALKAFTPIRQSIPIFSADNNAYWFKCIIKNNTHKPTLMLTTKFANIEEMDVFKYMENRFTNVSQNGTRFPFYYNRSNSSPNFIVDLQLPENQIGTYYFKIKTRNPLILPISVNTKQSIYEAVSFENLVIGLYVGVMLAIFFYNFFLFFFTKDKSYLIYIVYILFLGLAQVSISGYTYKYLWPNSPTFNSYSLVLLSALAGMTGIAFSLNFLQLKTYTNKWITRLLYTTVALYIISISAYCFHKYDAAFNILNINAILGSVLLLAASIICIRKNFTPAYYYSIAWIFFLSGITIFALRNLSILPYNNFTTYYSYTGSALQGILLSIALANRINILRKEKEISQRNALEASLENERIIRERNVFLEQKVKERTADLQASNEKLEQTLTDLKDAQAQLVEAEKMASLGQLTAGIAHEINNPINFVKANISPLQMDVKDLFEIINSYDELQSTELTQVPQKLQQIEQLKKQIDVEYVKTEIEGLVKGIKEGAERTAEIVNGLRNFSRLDESEIKTVNIHEGLQSTLILLKNKLSNHISIETNFNAYGTIECFPGKLNQVFMNLIGNAIEAIHEKDDLSNTEKIYISTEDIENQIVIRIKDTGPGIKPAIMNKIFDPFFTTKDVGKGTGLGLSIVYKIIKKHGGNIRVESNLGKGAEFIITLNHTLPQNAEI